MVTMLDRQVALKVILIVVLGANRLDGDRYFACQPSQSQLDGDDHHDENHRSTQPE